MAPAWSRRPMAFFLRSPGFGVWSLVFSLSLHARHWRWVGVWVRMSRLARPSPQTRDTRQLSPDGVYACDTHWGAWGCAAPGSENSPVGVHPRDEGLPPLNGKDKGDGDEGGPQLHDREGVGAVELCDLAVPGRVRHDLLPDDGAEGEANVGHLSSTPREEGGGATWVTPRRLSAPQESEFQKKL